MSKIQLQDFVKYGRLFEIYGNMLSEDRQKIMISYFEYNMTLVEIAQERQISRQAVLDAINKACKKLDSYEKSLRVLDKTQDIEESLKEIKTLAENASQTEIAQKVDNVLRKI